MTNVKRDVKQSAIQKEVVYNILDGIDYGEANLVVMAMGKDGLILQDMDTGLYTEIKVTMKNPNFDAEASMAVVAEKALKQVMSKQEKEAKVKAEKEKDDAVKAKAKKLAQQLQDELASAHGDTAFTMKEALAPKAEGE